MRGFSTWSFPARSFLPRAPLLFVLVLVLLQPAGIGAQTTRLIPVRPVMGAASRPGSGGRTGVAAAGLARTAAGIPIPPQRPHLSLARPAGLRSSPRAVLARAAGGSLGPEESGGSLLAGPSLPDTLRVLVLRVAFPADEDPETTGDGSFDLRTLEQFESDEGHVIDAAPHDRGYTERHLQALHHYWWAASDGALSISAEVLPSAVQGAFLLPHGIAHYGFRSPLGSIEAALSALVADAVAAAGAAAATGGDVIDWTTWDAFVVFHAGADWQGDMAGARDTQADIPTAYIALGDPVAVGGAWVWDATILPETVSQDGWTGAINGIFAHEFGHQLGLPDLYDVEAGDTAVGYFALMDLGDTVGGIIEDRYVFGLLPAGISPWTRAYLGWAEAAGPGPDGTITLKASTALEGIHDPSPGVKVGRVRIGESQWLLAEYRSDDLDGEVGVSLYWDRGVIDGTARLQGEEKVRTYEYDALLPGAGVLFWHLDEGVAFLPATGGGTNLEANTLQADRLRRFLDVEEADGLQQLGWLPGYYGEPGDFWGPGAAGNDGPATFGPATEPNTASWTGARTGLALTVTVGADPIERRLAVASESPAPLFTLPFPHPSPTASVPWLVDFEDGNGPRVAVLDSLGGLHLFTLQGAPAAGPNPVWTAPQPPRFPLTHAARLTISHSQTASYWVVTAGDSLWFLDGSGQQAAAVDLGGVAVARPAATEGMTDHLVTVAIEGGRVLAVGTGGVLAEAQISGEIQRLAVAPHSSYTIVATREQVFDIDHFPDYLDVRSVWSSGESEIVDLVAGDAIVPDVPPEAVDYGLGVLDSAGRLTLLLGLGNAGQPSDPPLSVLSSVRQLVAPVGRPAVAWLEYDYAPAVLITTGEGVRAFHFDGVPASGWNARSRGRAAVPYPSPVGGLVTLHKEGVAGFSAEDELLLWDSQGVLQSHVIRQWPYRAVAPFSLGDRGLSAEPVFFLVGADSLQASLLSTPFHLPAQVTGWVGLQGGPEGRGWIEGRAIDSTYEPPSLNLYVYPNPARDRCTIRIEGLTGRVRVHAFTRTGTNLGLVADLESPTFTVGEVAWDVSRLAPGVYFLVGEQGWDRTLQRVRTTVLVVR